MGHHNCALTAGALHLGSYSAKNRGHRVLFGYRTPYCTQRVDPGKFERCRLEVGAFKGLNIEKKLFSCVQSAFVIHADQDRCNLEQGIRLGIEATGFNIDDNGQKASEPVCDR